MNLDRVIAVRTTKTVYRDGNLAIKVFDDNFSKADIFNEALNHARVEESGLSIPRVIEVKKIEGKWAIVMDFIEGKTLARMMEENPGKRDEFIDRFVDIHLLVHNQKVPLLNTMKEKFDRKIFETDLDANTRYDLRTRLHGMPTHTKLCHGDFNPSNIILTAEDVPYIIDWSHATQGNASADAARTYLLFSLEGNKEMAEKYLALFCEKSNTPRNYVQKWLPIVAASQLLQGKPEERKFLMRWAAVVDFE